MTLEEIEQFAKTYIELIKLKNNVNGFTPNLSWNEIESAFIDGAKTAVIGGIDWKK